MVCGPGVSTLHPAIEEVTKTVPRAGKGGDLRDQYSAVELVDMAASKLCLIPLKDDHNDCYV
jgi:hypothetical protein